MNPLPPILFLHGLATTGARTWGDNGWHDLVKDAERDSIVLDLPGHGQNYNSVDKATFNQSLTFIRDSLPAVPIDAVGFSLGARMLLTIATENPSAFRKLVLSGIGENIFTVDTSKYKSIHDGIAGNPNPEDPESRYFHQLSESVDINRSALQKLIASPTTELKPESLRDISCPVLVVLGDDDFAAPATKLLELLPNATYLELKKVDHFATPKNFTFIETALNFIDAEPNW